MRKIPFMKQPLTHIFSIYELPFYINHLAIASIVLIVLDCTPISYSDAAFALFVIVSIISAPLFIWTKEKKNMKTENLGKKAANDFINTDS